MINIYFKKEKYGYACADMSALARVTEISRNTLTNWFRNGKTTYENETFLIYRATYEKSNKTGNIAKLIAKSIPIGHTEDYNIDNSIAD
jgi:hypothetical protein